MNLNKEDVILLIQAYEKQRVLWDPKEKWYFNKNKKNYAWEEIAKCVNIDVEDAKKKMSSLLGSFRREKSKRRRTMGTGKGVKGVYKSDWFALKSFKFLMNKDEQRQTINSQGINANKEDEIDENNERGLTETTDVKPEVNYNDTTELFSSTPKPFNNVQHTQVDESRIFVKPTSPRRKISKVRESVKLEPRVQNALEYLRPPMLKEDLSTHTFGKYVGEKLNQFDPNTKAVLIHKINQLIFNAEIENIRTRTDMSHCATDLMSPPLSSSASSSAEDYIDENKMDIP